MIEVAKATPAGPNGRPIATETTKIPETNEVEDSTALPRPWLTKSQLATAANGAQRAETASPAKTMAASSQFGPRTVRVMGFAKASNSPPSRQLENAAISYNCQKVDR